MTLRKQKPNEAALAEFAALRDEIAYRSRFQQLMIHLSLVISGALLAVALPDPGATDLLLLIPLVSTGLGLFFADHARTITRIGRYIHEELSITEEGTVLLGWEEWIHRKEEDLPLFRRMHLPLSLIFLVPPAAALAYWIERKSVDTAVEVVIPVGEALLTLFMGFVLMSTRFKDPFDRAPSG